ncbi:glycosyltransferase, partial [bacterium]|nr:glycosyltransferase [bacterium]
MRIFYVLERFPVLSQTFVLNEIIEMMKLGHEIKILSLLPPLEKIKHESFEEYKLDGFVNYVVKDQSYTQRVSEVVRNIMQITVPSILKVGINIKNKMHKALGNRIEDYAISMGKEILGSFKADIIHAHFCDISTYVAMELSKQEGIPYTFSAHGFDIYVSPPSNWKERVDLSKGCIVYTQYNKDHLVKTYNIDVEKIKVVSHGVDV